ncbi:MAG: hypothetical protein JKY52_08480 [Flavobacteriales bacterium]|nr:hypothetical protein [Flavobacteriales bacterium]
MNNTGEYLILKWGTLEGWDIKDGTTLGLMKAYFSLGASTSAMTQQDTADQKVVLLPDDRPR